MSPMEFIRRKVLGLSQAGMASLTEVNQATVSRWERGTLEPDRAAMARIRAQAELQGIKWRDKWFFEAPK